MEIRLRSSRYDQYDHSNAARTNRIDSWFVIRSCQPTATDNEEEEEEEEERLPSQHT